jgi:hypothetical protein
VLLAQVELVLVEQTQTDRLVQLIQVEVVEEQVLLVTQEVTHQQEMVELEVVVK